MPVINRRESYKGASRTGLLIAVALHVIVAIIFFNTDAGHKTMDYIIEAATGKTQPPPPPPKPPMSKAQTMKPSNIIPKFEIRTQTRIDPGFTPSFKEFSSIGSDVGAVNFTNMAQNYSSRTFNLDASQVKNVTSDILSQIGIPDFMDRGRGTRVSGIGKRMRARLSLCLINTPGVTTLGATGRSTSTKATTATSDQDVLNSRESWDYIFKKYSSFDRARQWLRSNTQIQVTDNTISLPMDVSYDDWVTNIRTKGAVAIDSTSVYHESSALGFISHAIEKLERNKISGKNDFVDDVQKAIHTYIRKKYEIETPEILPPDMLIKSIEKRNVLREWRKRGLIDAINSARALNADMQETLLLRQTRQIYRFFAEAQALENPLIVVANIIGLEQISEENMEILRTYVRNGGFIWVDDPGIATANVKDLHKSCRSFISNLMKFDEKGILSEKDSAVFSKLSTDDRRVQGFSFNEPLLQFVHPQIKLPVIVPQSTPATIRFFNRLGIPVKQFVWTRENLMPAGTYITEENAFVWNCDNNDGEPVESGVYFAQMEAGLFQKTVVAHVGKLRKLDEKHPLMGVVHNFRNVPICAIEAASSYWQNRPFGNAAFGYYLGSRMVLLYTEGAGVIAGLGDINNPVGMEQASRFMNNVIAFCLSDEDGVAIRP